MPKKRRFTQKMSRFFLIAITAIAGFVPAPMALADFPILRQSIIDYNLKNDNKSLSNGSYDGAAGILQIRPEIARSFGLTAFINQDYIAAKALNIKADRLFAQAVSALKSREKERFAGEHAESAMESALASKEALVSVRKHFAAYRSKLTPQIDERLNKKACSVLLDRLLEESLKKASFNLRDGLGIFYNRCQGLPENSPPLTPENVRFVNFVFSELQQKGSDADKKSFDLGKQERRRGTRPGSSWKNAVKKEGPHFVALVEKCLERKKKSGYPVDPLLFIALMKRESNFDPRAVSYVGAAGLTQIMPKTGKGLGMKQIYMPSYFETAVSLMKRERKLRQRGIGLISKITKKNKTKQARLARKLMQESLDLGRKRSGLFSRYKKELLEKDRDDRLNPGKAMKYGYKYFSDLMRTQKGDISLALASYNAGPHRVKQYNGVPPYAETVTFRNTVLRYYREYLNGIED